MQESASTILRILKKTYPKAGIALTNWKTPWELLVAVQLSAQCTDARVNSVTTRLFAKYKTLDDYIRADIREFERDIRPTGFYHNKAKNILGAARIVGEHFRGGVPKTMQELLMLPGVGRKTANVVLGNAYGVVVGIAVDTHVRRLSRRLHLVNPDLADPEKIETELMAVIPKKNWFCLTYLLIEHGRACCRALRPDCASCVIRAYCPSKRA
ncbi:endonuclease III [Candidatus Gottesmanbacteria bacterium RIFOXYB1_FULL_47_11]|uniref:Endonuclease III n=1 Tax=Candidatus Gottesmanbacteria bacterium RIFOXYB1_FULL_47_11 TaxID=1798401 RepID=A0A1F6BCT6_9BACT|nr:MAG: endonuclease III [Candidatus Gottesmanbacteria bacterium RIFOXYB1_FULL_47_11]